MIGDNFVANRNGDYSYAGILIIMLLGKMIKKMKVYEQYILIGDLVIMSYEILDLFQNYLILGGLIDASPSDTYD